jgi:hypothetical protein
MWWRKEGYGKAKAKSHMVRLRGNGRSFSDHVA